MAVSIHANRTRTRALCPPGETGAVYLTLLDLVQTVGEITDDEAEIVATVIHLLRSGQVKLAGNFRDEPISRFLD